MPGNGVSAEVPEHPGGHDGSHAGPNGARGASEAPDVLAVETHDFVDLVPTERPRAQSMDGFDDRYTDIVDYIVRCTHKIWDERDIGLIYTHYTHNCALYTPLGTIHSREEVVRDTIQRLVSFPERRGQATQVIWSGDDRAGFYTSHLVTGVGRHTQNGHLGPPTHRPFTSRTIADCMILRNMIYREYLVTDQMAILRQLGIDADGYATRLAKAKLAQGLTAIDIGETGTALGQYPPAEKADLSLAATDPERHTLQWMHDVWNRKMFGRIREVYAPTVQWHGPLTRDLFGVQAVTHQSLGLVGTFPDAHFQVQHVCSTPCVEGGTKVAVRWLMEGHHLGYGILESLPEPTGKRVQVMGMTHLHYRDGRIVDDWTLYDELSLLVQVRMAQLADRPATPVIAADAAPAVQ